jgi:hypothetical protein
MDDVLSHKDASQLYEGALFHYRKDIVRIREYAMGTVTLYNLRTKKTSAIMFNRKEFTPVTERIGMVNISQTVVVIVRNTLRQYQISISPNNVNISYPPVKRPLGATRQLTALKSLEAPELLAAINNDYPSIDEAYAKAIEWKGACAFDKQFAITDLGSIIYKDAKVGMFVNSRIEFNQPSSYLESLLNNSHEKTSRTYQARPI